MSQNTTCTTFNLWTYAPTSLEEDLIMTPFCIPTSILLTEYIVVIALTSIFLLLHIALLRNKLKTNPEFIHHNGFVLILLQLLISVIVIIEYLMLLTGFMSWLSVLVSGVFWQHLMVWVDLLVYAM